MTASYDNELLQGFLSHVLLWTFSRPKLIVTTTTTCFISLRVFVGFSCDSISKVVGISATDGVVANYRELRASYSLPPRVHFIHLMFRQKLNKMTISEWTDESLIQHFQSEQKISCGKQDDYFPDSLRCNPIFSSQVQHYRDLLPITAQVSWHSKSSGVWVR